MKFEKWLEETTVAGDIAQPLARGKVDVVGAGCPEGMVRDKKGICVPKGEKISEYQELYRTDRYDLIAKKLMKQFKGKKITFRDIEQAIIDEFAPQPFDRYDHQEVVDRLKEKRFKVESSKLREAVVLTDPEALTAQWKKKAKENPDVAHWMHIAGVYKKAALKCQKQLKKESIDEETMKGDTLNSSGTKSVFFGKGLVTIRAGRSEVILTKQEAQALVRSIKEKIK